MKSFTSNIKHSMTSLIRFIHDGAIIENENQIEAKVNRDAMKESSSETVVTAQSKERSNDLNGKNHESCCGHFF